MIDLLAYLLKNGTATQPELFPDLSPHSQTLPKLSPNAGQDIEKCIRCDEICPTGAIRTTSTQQDQHEVSLDLGACIGCGECMRAYPNLFLKDCSSKVAVTTRGDLVKSTTDATKQGAERSPARNIFKKSLAIRVVSTGCSACDLEIGATGNPIFDAERFGIQVVASPRTADALLVTGPVPKAMHEPLRRTYEAMAEPRLVIAAGTCAITGGVHRGGYAEANGVEPILPVDVYIPGCPPHPWNIIDGLFLAMGKR